MSSIMEMTMEKSTSFAAEGRGEKTHARRARSTAENNGAGTLSCCAAPASTLGLARFP